MKSLLIYLFGISILNASCRNTNSANTFEDIGEFDEYGKETGTWILKDSVGKIGEKGQFLAGLRIGKWEYFKPIQDEWKWKPISSPNGTIKTSLPEFIELEQNNDSLVVASSIDSTIGFTTVISVTTPIDNSLYNYTNSAFEDIRRLNIRIIDSARQAIETVTHKKYIYHQILCLKPNGDTVRVYNFTTIKKNKLIEVTVRCENRLQLFGRRNFYSIIPYTYIYGERFMKMKDKIAEISGRREFD